MLTWLFWLRYRTSPNQPLARQYECYFTQRKIKAKLRLNVEKYTLLCLQESKVENSVHLFPFLRGVSNTSVGSRMARPLSRVSDCSTHTADTSVSSDQRCSAPSCSKYFLPSCSKYFCHSWAQTEAYLVYFGTLHPSERTEFVNTSKKAKKVM